MIALRGLNPPYRNYIQWEFSGTPKDMGTPENGKLDPYHSHIFKDSCGSGMGIVWEAYHKGVPLLGVPENPIDIYLDVQGS